MTGGVVTGFAEQMRHDRGAADVGDRRANSATLGVMPGISAITMTAGPVPLRKMSRVLPSWVNVVFSKSLRESSGMGRQRSPSA